MIAMKLSLVTSALFFLTAVHLNAWGLSNNTEPKSFDGVFEVEPGDYEILALKLFPENRTASFDVFLPLKGNVLVSVSESQSFLLNLDDKNVVHLMSSGDTGDFQEVASWSEDGDRWVHVTVDTTEKVGKILFESEWVAQMAFAETLAVTGSDVFYITDLAGERLNQTITEGTSEILSLNLDVSEMVWTRGKASINFSGTDGEGNIKPPFVLDPGREPGGRFTMLIERPINRKAILSTPASASFNLPENK